MDYPARFPDKEDDHADIQRQMIARERQDLIETIFDKLGAKCSQFLKLVYVKQLNADEIAETMQMTSKDVVKTTKNRCKNKLIALLEEFPHLAKSLSYTA